MSRLTLNNIPSLDTTQRQARIKNRHVKYRALNMQHDFHLRHVHSWHNMDPHSFHADVVHPIYAAQIHIRVTQLILPHIKEYDVRIATNPSSRTTACS